MRITTKIKWDMATGEVLEHVYHDYTGEVAECKGDGTAKDQLKLQNQLVQQQLARQNAQQDKVSNAVSGDLSGTHGYPPELLAALRSQFMNENTSAFQDAGSNVRAVLASRGAGTGALPVGGDFTRGIAELEAAKANSQSGGLLGINVDSLRQASTNRWNAVNALNGLAAQSGNNVGTFDSGASNALNQYVWAANQGFGNAFTTQFGGTFGKGLGQLATYGVGQALGKIPGMGGANGTSGKGGG